MVTSLKEYIVSVHKCDAPPISDLIIDIKSPTKLGTILDLAKKSLNINQLTLPMRPHDPFLDPELLQTQVQSTPQKPVFTHDSAAHTTEILSAKYEKADVDKIITVNCTHLSNP